MAILSILINKKIAIFLLIDKYCIELGEVITPKGSEESRLKRGGGGEVSRFP